MESVKTDGFPILALDREGPGVPYTGSLLHRADLVKFARARPDSDGAVGFVREVGRFVEETGASGAQQPPVGAA